MAGHVQHRLRRPTGTIHCSAINAQGDISCTTTTSGLAFKIPGRVGDSPIIGAGLYADNEIGSCGSTGRGEANLQNLCSFAAVELMRSGMSPREAGLEICRRVASHTKRRTVGPARAAQFRAQVLLARQSWPPCRRFALGTGQVRRHRCARQSTGRMCLPLYGAVVKSDEDRLIIP